MFGNDYGHAPRERLLIYCFVLFKCLGNMFVNKPMYSLRLVMILATGPASVHAFLILLLCVGNMFLVNVCVPYVWQCFSPLAPRAFTCLLLFIRFGLHFRSKPMYFLCSATICARRPASIHVFLSFPNVWLTISQ